MNARVEPVPVFDFASVVNMSAAGPGLHTTDMTTPSRSSAITHSSAPEVNGKPAGRSNHLSPPDSSSSSSHAAMAAPSGAHQPKIVQTAFIHKLYNMLEDTTIQHLISWSSNTESFVMSPSPDFSKVLSQYFKHTNVSSFNAMCFTQEIRTRLWEFKHGNGSFKRGDIMGLREIKRRASRHALVNRDSNYKSNSSHQTASHEPGQMTAESTEARLTNMEHSLYEVTAWLQCSEENVHCISVKHQNAVTVLNRLIHYNQELSRAVLSLVPVNSTAHRDVIELQGEMQRQVEVVQMSEESHEVLSGGRPSFLGITDNAPVSPKQSSQDDSRRAGGLTVPQHRGQALYRQPTHSSVMATARRPYGSISGNSTTQSSPLRTANPPATQSLHPLSNVETPPGNLARRHTAADIRAHGWQPTVGPYLTPIPTSAPWPPSPGCVAPEDQRIRDSLSSYSLQAASRPATPPSHGINGASNGVDAFSGWSWNSATNKDFKTLALRDSSVPPTRRGSMAHILNPSDTAEWSDEDEDLRGEDRKRQ